MKFLIVFLAGIALATAFSIPVEYEGQKFGK